MKIHKNLAFSLALVVGLVIMAVSSTQVTAATTKYYYTNCYSGQTYGTGKGTIDKVFRSALVNQPASFYTVNPTLDGGTIKFYLDGALLGTNTKNFPDSGGLDGIYIDTRTYDNGTYRLTGTVTDKNSVNYDVLCAGNDIPYVDITVKNAPKAQFAYGSSATYGNADSSYLKTFSTTIINATPGTNTYYYYLNNALKATNSKVNGFDGYSIDTTTLPSGTYDLTGKVRNSAGDESDITTADGLNKIHFSVVNAAPTTTPPPNVCAQKQDNINAITTRIVQRSENQLQVLDASATSLEHYYVGQTKKITNYQDLVNAITKAGDETQTNLIKLVNASTITCDSNGKPKLEEFIKAFSALQKSIADYRTNIQKLLTALENL